MLAVLGGLAEVESSLIHAHTGEGGERAKARAVKMGPKFKLTPHQMREAIKRRAAGIAAERGKAHAKPARPLSKIGTGANRRLQPKTAIPISPSINDRPWRAKQIKTRFV